MQTLTKRQAISEANALLASAVTKSHVAKACVRKALALCGKDSSGVMIFNAAGRSKLALIADARIDANPSSQDVYDLAACYRSSQACLVMARKSRIIEF